MAVKKPKGPSTLAEYFAGAKGRQAALVQRCKDAGHPVSQAHLSRIAVGGPCSFGLAKVVSQITGVPMKSFGYDLEGVA